MKLIDPNVVLIEESNPFKKVEIVGRTCYKSTSEMTEETAKKFFKVLTSRNHTAMVEHATFVFEVTPRIYYNLLATHSISKYMNFSYYNGRCLVSSNLRALNESGSFPLLKALYQYDPALIYCLEDREVLKTYLIGEAKLVNLFELPVLHENEFMAHAYFTFRFTCDRGVSHEIVRHRVASFAQESTRYVNYSRSGEMQFITPYKFDEWGKIAREHFISTCEIAQLHYNAMIALGMTPQQSRAVLPNALKTELIMTANAKNLEHFFNLRSRGTTGAPHPDMKVVADMALELYSEVKNRVLG